MLVAQVMRLAHPLRQLHVVVAQLGQHVERRDVVRVVVEDALQLRDVADRAHRRAAELAHTLGDHVGRGEDLSACSSSSR